MPLAVSFFIVAGLCGMGVPGFASFWAELLVFIAAVRTYPVLGIAAIAGLVFTAAYMLRVFGKAMFGPRNPEWENARRQRAGPSPSPRAILVGVLVCLRVLPSLILDMIRTRRGGSRPMGDLEPLPARARSSSAPSCAFVLLGLGAPVPRASWPASVVMAGAWVVATRSRGWVPQGEPFFPGIYRVDAFSQLLKLGIAAGLLLSILIAAQSGQRARPRSRVDACIVPLLLRHRHDDDGERHRADHALRGDRAVGLRPLHSRGIEQACSRDGSEAAAKYVLFGAAASAVTLFGISLIFGVARSTLLSDIWRRR